MRGKNLSAAAIAQAAAAVLLMAGILTFAHPCLHDDGSVSACFGTSRALIGMGVVALVAVVARIAKPGAAAVTDAIVLVMGLAAALLPGRVLPLCMMQTMHCQAVMRPFALACGAVMALSALADLLLSRLAGRQGA